jgi:hypothetical protein
MTNSLGISGLLQDTEPVVEPSMVQVTEPITEHVVQVAEPVVQVAEHVVQVAEPVVQVTEHVVQVTEPIAEHVVQVAEPVVQVTEPIAEPVVQVAEPVVQVAESDVKSVAEPFKDDNQYIKLENKGSYQVLVVSPNKIEKRDWKSPTYLSDLLSDTFCKYETINPEDYIMKIATFLEIPNYAYPDVKVHIISESTEWMDEIMYIDVFSEYKIDSLKNEFASLLNIDGDIIYGNAIITRTRIPSTDNLNIKEGEAVPNMWYIDVNKENMEEMLYNRANTMVVLYDSDNEKFFEQRLFGPLDNFAQDFFGEAQYTYKKIEFGFLKHNINVWYSENKYGCLDVFGNLLPELSRVDKMIVFTMWTDNYRGNITLDEFNKIKYLSKKLTDYTAPENLLEDTYDHIHRLIIKNKYRILNTVYNSNN